MHVEAIRQYCLAKEGAWEDFPFGEQTLVLKVGQKIFALCSLDTPELRLNLKCDPSRALDLREQFPEAIQPGYHMNKKHWNSLYPEQGLSPTLVRELIDHSYELVAGR